MMLASKHCISSVLAQRCQLERAGNRAAVRKRVLGGTGRERKIRLRPALLGLFERKEIVHPFPSKHRSARRASTLLLTMECVGSVSLEFVLNKSDSDIENNSATRKMMLASKHCISASPIFHGTSRQTRRALPRKT